ncbi:MAG: hypothetical protein QNJ97_17140 [Myxococcota bacterium]|nr:hypothetical protein [Myxococcota bacterium]
METNTNEEMIDTSQPVERLVLIADAIFDRATTLDSVKLIKKDDEAEQTIAETRDEGFNGVIAVWRLIIDMLPTSGLEFTRRRQLEIDAYKVISRCHHRLKNLEKAIGAITKAIDLGYLDGFISLGAIRIDSGDEEGAEAAFKTALAKNTQTMRAHAGLAEIYFNRGTVALRNGDAAHVDYFEKAEEEFIAAGKERFTDAFERAMDLFETIGWKDRALSIGEKAAQFYSENRLKYGDGLRNMDARIRKLAGERYERILSGVGRTLGDIVGGKQRNPHRK